MANFKIMVDFDHKLVVHTQFHAGSNEYKELLNRGYVEVGVLKLRTNPSWKEVMTTEELPEVEFYWKDEYFSPEDKYLRKKD